MIATQEEMEAARLKLEQRDYCAHHLIAWKICRKEYFPMNYKCKHEKHIYDLCEFDEYVHVAMFCHILILY